MNSFDDIKAILDKLKGEPAPEYIQNDIGISHKAIQARAQRRWHEWNRGDIPLPYEDEIPY